jgi:hypothetical protein
VTGQEIDKGTHAWDVSQILAGNEPQIGLRSFDWTEAADQGRIGIGQKAGQDCYSHPGLHGRDQIGN